MNRLLTKTARTILIVALAFGSLGIAQTSARAASANEWQKAYKLQLQKLAQSNDFGWNEYVSLIDIDRDGIPELFAGSAYRTENDVSLAYTFKNGKAQPIQQKGPGLGILDESAAGFEIGMSAFIKGDLKIFKHKKNGSIIVIGQDGTSSITGGMVGEYVLKLKGTTLMTEQLNTVSWNEPEEPDGADVYEYSIRGKEVSKEVYEKSRSTYYAALQGISSGIKTVNGQQLASWENGIVKVNNKAINDFLGIQ